MRVIASRWVSGLGCYDARNHSAPVNPGGSANTLAGAKLRTR